MTTALPTVSALAAAAERDRAAAAADHQERVRNDVSYSLGKEFASILKVVDLGQRYSELSSEGGKVVVRIDGDAYDGIVATFYSTKPPFTVDAETWRLRRAQRRLNAKVQDATRLTYAQAKAALGVVAGELA